MDHQSIASYCHEDLSKPRAWTGARLSREG